LFLLNAGMLGLGLEAIFGLGLEDAGLGFEGCGLGLKISGLGLEL